ncbi:MAG: lipopolysaccharide biosynthesis protein [Actinomycetota bacterium]|nr:lipopolysaccharide biosynthesis protein [Actinomycetota bacterium]
MDHDEGGRQSEDRQDSAEEPRTAPAGITASAVKGFGWQVASFGGNRVIVFLSTLALARLLIPRDFGVFAAALTFAQYLEVLLDFGIGSYLVYDQERGVTDRLHVAFTLNLILTAVLATITVVASPLLADLFGAPHRSAVFAAMAGYLVLRGLSQVNEALIQRDLLFKKLVFIELLGSGVRAGLSVGLALDGTGVWAIVTGFLAGQAVTTVAAYAVVRYRPRLRISWQAGKTMLAFGVSSVALDILGELALNGDYLVVGGRLGATALGVYTMAYRLPELLINNLFWMFSKVAFPIYARSRSAGLEVLKRAMLRALKFTSVYGFAAGVGMAVSAPDIVAVIFGPQWQAAVAPMVLVSLAAAIASTTFASGPLYPALGQPGRLVRVNIPLTISRMVGFIVAAPYGLVWVAAVHLATNAVNAFVRLGIANRVAGTTATATFRALIPALSVGLGVALFTVPLAAVLPTGLVGLVILVAAGVSGAVVAVAVSERAMFGEIRHLLRVLATMAE